MKKIIVIFMLLFSSNILFASDVNSLIDGILKHEGSSLEVGGGSKYGITYGELKRKKMDLNGDGKITHADVPYVSRNIAIKIYKSLFKEYYPQEKSKLVNEILIPVLFDTSINMGDYFAKKTIVNATNILIARKRMEGQKVSYVTEATVFQYLNTLNEQELKKINNTFVDLRINKYVSLCKQKKYAKYKNGWLKRANSFRI
jgi:lysozyme family protein